MQQLAVRLAAPPILAAAVAIGIDWLANSLRGFVPGWMLPGVFQYPLTYSEYVWLAAAVMFPLWLALLLAQPHKEEK